MLEVYKLEQSYEWDEIVRSFKNYDVYWLSGYVKAFKIHGDGEPLLFYYKDENTKGINVVMKRDVAEDKHFVENIPKSAYFDFATPYGYGGWIVEGDSTEALFQQYFEWCKNNGIISEFIRFHPVLNNQIRSRNEYKVIDLGNTVTLDLSSQEEIWANITSKNRNMIRKAQKAGIEIYNDRSEVLFEQFRDIYNATMKKDEAEEYYFFGNEFYKSIFNDLPENAQLFYAVLDNEIIAASIMIYADGKLNYHLSGSEYKYRSLAPSNLLLYKAALWGCENGCKTFHLGGGVGSGEDNLFKFKKSFYRKDDLTRFSIGQKVIDEDKYNELLDLRDDLHNTGYFPKYRG